VHYLLVKALEKAGLKYADVQVVFLAPADARAAFERGAVDAWVIWDPFLAAAEKQLGARVLADGKGLVSNHQFYLASRGYAARQPQVVRAVVEELSRLDQWADDIAGFCDAIGADAPILLGQSGGSIFTQHFLTRHPSRAKGATWPFASSSIARCRATWRR